MMQFKPGETVLIKTLDLQGRVMGKRETMRGTQYLVRYFHNGDAKECYFFDDEIFEAKKC